MTHCPTCSGLGVVWESSDILICPTCDGTGILDEAPLRRYRRDLVSVAAAVALAAMALYVLLRLF